MRTGDERFFDLIEHTLERICEGGIYDHLGGGFSRYSVDERWLVPHFEKMLYDNAQLLELLALAHVRTGQPAVPAAGGGDGRLARPRDDDAGRGVLGLAGRRFGGRGGQVLRLVAGRDRQALGPDDAAFFVQHYDVTPRATSKATISSIFSSACRAATKIEARLAMLRDKLFMLREKRVRPGLDDKVLADWNGLMIAALANAGSMLGEPDWIELAERAFDFIAQSMTKGDRLGHSWREGRLLYPGLASDFANMIRAALALYEATGQRTGSTRRCAGSGVRRALRQSG